MASQWRLMWWKFKRHRIALVSGIFLSLLYAMILICEFLAPYNLHTRNVDFIHSPPQRIHLFHDGEFVGPFVYGREMTLDMDTLKRDYTDNHNDVQPIRFFCHGDPYRSGDLVDAVTCIWSARRNDGQMFLLGHRPAGARRAVAHHLWRADFADHRPDRHRHQLSCSASVIGGFAGYHGGVFDLVVQRIIEVLQSLPSIPLWMALAAIMPVTWSPSCIYFGITIILGAARLDGTGTRGAFEAFGIARRRLRPCRATDGRKSSRIIARHLCRASCRI